MYVLVELAADPIVIFGVPRSGTTYLERILNSHPEVFISHETRIFGWLYNAIEVLPGDDRLLLSHREAFLARLRDVLPELIRDVYGELAPQARWWGDKNPFSAASFNAGSLALVADLFPGSRFIHIIRDGRDVVASLIAIDNEDTRSASLEGLHHVWIDLVDRGVAFGREIGPERYLELRYEDLIADDATVASNVLRFLEIDPDPAVEAFCRQQSQNRDPFSAPTRDISEGVATSNWSSVLTAQQQERSLAMLGPHLVRYGYETERSLAELTANLRQNAGRAG